LKFIDYELEIEYINDISQELIDLFATIGISFENNVEGKYSRFMKRRESLYA